MATPTPDMATSDLPAPETPAIQPCYLDPLLPHFIPAEPDKYDGTALLRFDREALPLDPAIPYFPMQAKESYNSIRTTSDYTPPEQHTDVELPSQEKLLASGEGRSKDTSVFETSQERIRTKLPLSRK